MIQPKKLKRMPRDRGEPVKRIGTRPRPYIEPREWPAGTTAKDRIHTLLDEKWRTVRDFAELADIGDASARNYLQMFTETGIVETMIGNGAEPNRYRKKQEATFER
jgi:hypothetical protein